MSATDDDLAMLRYLEGVATDAEVAALDRRMRDDPDLRRGFIEFANIHAQLAECARLPRTVPRPARRWPRIVALSAAALVVAASALWTMSLRRTADGHGPRVAACHGGIQLWRGDRALPLATGFALASGDRLTLDGDAGLELSWQDRAHVAVDAGGDVSIGSGAPTTLRLALGVLHVRVTGHDPVRPFAIATDEGIATDRGTVFAITRGIAAGTRVDVESGSVELDAGGARATATAGHSVTAAPGAPAKLVVAAPIPPPRRAAAPLPRGAAEWAAVLPAQRTLVAMPPGLAGLAWRVAAPARLLMTVDGAAAHDVLRRAGGVLGTVPLPDLVALRPAVRTTKALVLLDAAGGRAWEIGEPEVRADGRLVGSLMTPLAAGGAAGVPALGGLLTMDDVRHGTSHALAAAVPAAVLSAEGLRIGDRISLADDALDIPPAGALRSHGAWIVGTADEPTLYVDMRMPADQRETLASDLQRLAPALRRVATVSPAGGDF